MVYTIDTTRIDEKGWNWSVGSLAQVGKFVAYVNATGTTHQAIGDSPQEVLDAAMAKVEAEMDNWVAELMGAQS